MFKQTKQIKTVIAELGFNEKDYVARTTIQAQGKLVTDITFINLRKAAASTAAMTAHGLSVSIFYQSEELGAPIVAITATYHLGVEAIVKDI